jgi:radical SAM superfamily enzyme YgiQ (UPF0313 family)/predicted SAM-dependent methyltransferase
METIQKRRSVRLDDKLKICLYCSRDEYYPVPALGIAYIASYLVKKGIVDKDHVIIADSFDEVRDFSPSVVGISSTSQVFQQALDFARKCKEHTGAWTVLGGYHISVKPESLPKEFDFGVIGEGENTFIELVGLKAKGTVEFRDLKSIKGICYHHGGEVVLNAPRELIKDLDNLPFPIFQKRYSDEYPIFTSRGCPYRCTFCASHLFWKDRIRFRSAESVVEEIVEAVERYHYQEIYILDDLWLSNEKRFQKIVELLEARNIPEKIRFKGFCRSNLIFEKHIKLLKRLNYTIVRFGGETGSNALLQKIKGKNISIQDHIRVIDLCAQYGLPCSASFMFGVPGESLTDIELTRKFLIQHRGRLSISGFYFFNPVPGTKLWDDLVEADKISNDFDLSNLQLDLSRDNFSWETAEKGYFNEENIPFRLFREKIEVLKAFEFGPKPFIRTVIHDLYSLNLSEKRYYIKNSLPVFFKRKLKKAIGRWLNKIWQLPAQTLQVLLAYFGLEIRRRTRRAFFGCPRPRQFEGAKVYVGCGNDRKDGYVGCDIRPLPNVDIVCQAWEISHCCQNVAGIYSRHMLEHLTFAEVSATLADWFQALAVGGKIKILVPNLTFHIDQWLKAEWTEEAFQDSKSNARWSAAGFWGWQRQCNPRQRDYENTYWDVHKSGYNRESIKFFLQRAGFTNIKTYVEDNVHIVAEAEKTPSDTQCHIKPLIEKCPTDP